jgi:hypothetical protein
MKKLIDKYLKIAKNNRKKFRQGNEKRGIQLI